MTTPPLGKVLVSGLFVGLLLASCGAARSSRIAALPPEQLAALSDHDICDGLAFNPDSASLQTEAMKRRLAAVEISVLIVGTGIAIEIETREAGP